MRESESGTPRPTAGADEHAGHASAREESSDSLRLAREVQFRLFPVSPPPTPGYDIAGASFASEVFDGDYFDFITMPDGRLVLAIGDACGHGLGAAMVMVQASACVRSLLSMTDDIQLALGRAGELLHGSMLESHFITMMLIELDPRRHRLRWVNAAHPPGLLLDRSGDVRLTLSSSMLPLGVAEDAWPAAPGECVIEPGETLLAVTDGVLEATGQGEGPGGGALGVRGVLATARSARGEGSSGMVEAIYEAAAGRAPAQADDMTVLALRRL